MRLVRVGIANVNATVGAVRSNASRAIAFAHQAAKDGCNVVAYPEQVISGYPSEDLVQWREFVAAQWRELERFAHETKEYSTAFALGVSIARDGLVYNCAALVRRGKICGLVPKEKLPTYNVFYEGRTFSRGMPGMYELVNGVPFGDLVFELDWGTMALEVCEDLWSPDGPMRRRCYAGAEIVVNVSASPFRVGISDTRREMIATRSADNQVTVVYSALVGANDGLVFDGGGYISQNGRQILETPRFAEGFHSVTLDLDRTARLRMENTTWREDQALAGKDGVTRIVLDEPSQGRDKLSYPAPHSFFLPTPSAKARDARRDFCEEVLDALTLGVGDYFEKVGAFKHIGVALSGGRDSLFCLLIAHRYALRAKKNPRELLRAFFMPSRFSSKETRAAAEAAAKELGVPLAIVSVDEAFDREVAEAAKMLQPGETLSALAKQNVQARLRAERMWTWANSTSGLFLQTSNMSEKAVGYTTVGGDLEGALAVIANLPKTVVNYLLDYLYETTKSEAIRLTLLKPPSAELAEDMEDERDLMPFPVLDACFALYAGEKMAPDEVKIALRAMFPKHTARELDAWADKFARLFTQSIYKWVQAPVSLHIGNLDLERERALQLPVVQRSEWQK